MSVAIMHLPL